VAASPRRAAGRTGGGAGGDGRFKVIGFRCRPPISSFEGMYKLRVAYLANRPNTLTNPATHGKVPETVRRFGMPGAMEAWWREIDAAGIEALALALKWPSIILSTDVYTFWPGGQLYQQSIEFLRDQFVYGSAYPFFGNSDTTLAQPLALPLSDTVMEKYLYRNASRLLGLS